MVKKLLAPIALLAVLLFWPVMTYAATYGSGTYGDCRFSEGCDPPQELPPEEEPPTAPNQVSRDVDSDGNLETATDTNANEADGFETFGDSDNSSSILRSLDGDDDGKTDFIISTDEDEFPERYWDPDNDILSTVQLAECDADTTAEWRFDIGPETRTYDPDTNEFLESCEAPSQPNTNPGSTGAGNGRGNGNGRAGDTRISKVLPFIADSPVYESIGRTIRKVPAPVAYGFPYLLLFLIILLVLRLVFQSRQEVNRLVVATRAQEAEKQLTLEKENFMMLSSHYLRTPITVINGNIELMQSLKQINEEVAKTLNSAGKLLMQQVSDLLDRLEQNKKLAMIQAPTSQTKVSTFVSPRLVLPVIAILSVLLLGQFLFIDFRVVSPNIVNILIQIVLAILLVQTFLSKLRQRQLSRHNRQDQERVLEEQRALDAARSEFILAAANNLEQQLNMFKQQLGDLINQPQSVKVKRALNELAAIIAKFRLVAFLQGQQLQAGKATFSMHEALDAAVRPYLEQAKARSISITDNIEDGRLYQQQQLLGIVLSSLVENAVKFSPDSGSIEVSAKHDGDKAVFSVRDHGKGIPKNKQELLFKPFSRTESAETFDTEGLGFSLYLDKVIANYLEGDIQVASEEGQGTTVTVAVPVSS